MFLLGLLSLSFSNGRCPRHASSALTLELGVLILILHFLLPVLPRSMADSPLSLCDVFLPSLQRTSIGGSHETSVHSPRPPPLRLLPRSLFPPLTLPLTLPLPISPSLTHPLHLPPPPHNPSPRSQPPPPPIPLPVEKLPHVLRRNPPAAPRHRRRQASLTCLPAVHITVSLSVTVTGSGTVTGTVPVTVTVHHAPLLTVHRLLIDRVRMQVRARRDRREEGLYFLLLRRRLRGRSRCRRGWWCAWGGHDGQGERGVAVVEGVGGGGDLQEEAADLDVGVGRGGLGGGVRVGEVVGREVEALDGVQGDGGVGDCEAVVRAGGVDYESSVFVGGWLDGLLFWCRGGRRRGSVLGGDVDV